jgi:hypothetical protein
MRKQTKLQQLRKRKEMLEGRVIVQAGHQSLVMSWEFKLCRVRV